MAIANFPNTPLLNDTFSIAGKTYRWNGVKWSYIRKSEVIDTTELSTFDGEIVPSLTGTYDLGDELTRWNNVFCNAVDGNQIIVQSLYVNDTVITASGGQLYATINGSGEDPVQITNNQSAAIQIDGGLHDSNYTSTPEINGGTP